tara:strand:+ start:2889 stop:3860 length:972 start_codon:yes stop_codon:yes gene_type:complete
MSNIIAVTIGDIKGVGIEILINSWKKKKINNFILLSDIKLVSKLLKNKNLDKQINLISLNNNKINFDKRKINIFSYKTISSEDNTYKSLMYAYKLCVEKICIGLITLPLRKDLIKKNIDKNFIGQTEFFQNINNKKYANMILYHEKIIVSPLTTHLKLKDIAKTVSNKSLLYNMIYTLNKTLKIDFKIKKPKLIVSGLNPHAGENGEIGDEEVKYIKPIISKLNKDGIYIDGPFSADSILINNNLKNYDCFIFMYHDQALVPFKYISQFSGVNYTGNLNIIRTSPDHGTAYNLVGTKKISDKSLINCFKLINQIHKNRKNVNT